MHLDDYQHKARAVVDPRDHNGPAVLSHLLGIVTETGVMVEQFQLQGRDGGINWSKAHLRDKVGDVLYRLTRFADAMGLHMRDVAAANLTRHEHRWIPTPAHHRLDTGYPDHEQLPATLTYVFTTSGDSPTASSPTTVVYCNGQQLGDPLTDSSRTGDGYRLHDVFHLAYATVLGWSPVTRALLGHKRRSNPATDEIEDGGRAIVIEEGIAVQTFAYAASRNYLRETDHVDSDHLATIATAASHLEVGARTPADWEQAILKGFRIWHELMRYNGIGTVHADLRRHTMTFTPTIEPSKPPAGS